MEPTFDAVNIQAYEHQIVSQDEVSQADNGNELAGVTLTSIEEEVRDGYDGTHYFKA